jgi:hypothetical protein
MLKFSVQTLYQPLFSNSPLAILLQFFSLPKASHTKKPQAKSKSQRQKPHISKQKPKAKAKAPLSPSGGLLYPVVNRVKQWFMGRGGGTL